MPDHVDPAAIRKLACAMELYRKNPYRNNAVRALRAAADEIESLRAEVERLRAGQQALTNSELLEIAKRNQPPQSYYEGGEEDL